MSSAELRAPDKAPKPAFTPPQSDLLCTFPRSAPPARHPRQNSCPFHCEPRAHPLCTHHQLLRCCIVRALYPLRSNPSQTEGRCKHDSPGDRTDFTGTERRCKRLRPSLRSATGIGYRVWGLGFGVSKHLKCAMLTTRPLCCHCTQGPHMTRPMVPATRVTRGAARVLWL